MKTIPTDVSRMIPNMKSDNFAKILKGLGMGKFTIPTSRQIVISYYSSSRPARKEALQNLTSILSPYGARYFDDGRAGYIQIGNVKIFLKPERVAGGVILKPNIFGSGGSSIVDKKIPYVKYKETLIKGIRDSKKLSEQQKEFLVELTELTEDYKRNKLFIRKLMEANKDLIPINTINNDFGELLGPMVVVKYQLLPIDAKSAVVFIPGRSNEPLLDYKITDKNLEYKISAKSGDTTNTLKPGDVNNLIKNSEVLTKKWGRTPQYAVIKALAEGTWKEGPISACKLLKKMGYSRQLSWISDETVYTEEVRQMAENELVKFSKEDLDFTEIFSDATRSTIYYVKFRLTPSGEMEWKILEEDTQKIVDKKPKRVVFRSKNYVGRPNGDKLGFQPN